MASLFVLQGPDQGATYSLDGDCVVFGRNHTCDVVLNVPEASREHARILRVGGKFFIEDLQSRNGTQVNDQDILGQVKLTQNDHIQICGIVLAFRDPSSPASTAEMESLSPDSSEEEPEDSSTVEVSLKQGLLHLENQSSEQLRTLLQISNELSRSLDVDQLACRIAERLFDLFKQADRGLVLLEDAATGHLIPRAWKTRPPHGKEAPRYLRSLVLHCMDRGQAILSDNTPRDRRFGKSPLVKEFHIHSVLCVPLCLQDGTAFGAIELDTRDHKLRFKEDDLHLLVCVAGQASLALENALLHRDLVARQRLMRDLTVAHQVQRCFLPQTLPQVPGYEFFAHSEPVRQVGGDYYDFVPLTNGRLALTLGDVAGKGVPAALLMAKLSAEARFFLLAEPDLAAVLGRLNQMLIQQGAPTDRFVTFAAAVLDPATHTLTLSSAGQPALLIYRRATGAVEEALTGDAVGIPLGVFEDWNYRTQTVVLQSGDCLIACTDAFTEAWNGQSEPFGRAGIARALAGGNLSIPEMGDCLLEAVRLHLDGRSPHDDLTLICAGRMP